MGMGDEQDLLDLGLLSYPTHGFRVVVCMYSAVCTYSMAVLVLGLLGCLLVCMDRVTCFACLLACRTRFPLPLLVYYLLGDLTDDSDRQVRA
jgi:hypothetical protein